MKGLLLLLMAAPVAAQPLKIVYFSGEYCGACAAMEPVWQQFARGRQDAVYVDIDQTDSSAYQRYGRFYEREREMPVVCWIRGQRLLARRAGLTSLAELQRRTRELSR